jgi:gamma-glutamyltranspeptidase/glutathione hydrolase
MEPFNDSIRGRGRSVVIAPHGMVASSQPLATQVGANVLQAGGTAVDAAIAMNAMLGLVEPMSCGLGGDLFALVWDSASHEVRGLNGSGRSPYSLDTAEFTRLDLKQIPERGPLSWTVPGCVDAWYVLHQRSGRLPMADLLAPTIAYAEEGFPVSPVISHMWKRSEEVLSEEPGTASTLLIEGEAPARGQRFRNPALGAVLQRLQREGREAFYRGAIADALVQFSESMGGFITLKDLADHTSTWVTPLSVPYRGYEVWGLPPNSQGLATLEMLRIIEGFDLRKMGHNSAELLHHLIEAKKLAFADRARFYADPDFYDAPIERLLSKAYAESQRQRISPDRAATEIPPDDARLRTSDTVYVTAVDADRNAASLIQSIYNGRTFGSGLAPRELGFALQNRGCLFNLDPEHPNRFEPHKRPFHTIIPGFVTQAGTPVFCFGVMGGDQQPQGQVQVLVNLIDFGMDAQEAGDALRFRHAGSSTPRGGIMKDGGTVFLERGFSPDVVRVLRSKGHRVEVRSEREDGNYGGYQGVWIDPQSGMLYGGSEPRKDGCAIGY